MKILQRDTDGPPFGPQSIETGTLKNRDSLETSSGGGSKVMYRPETELVSQEGIPHNAGSLLEHLIGPTGTRQ